MLTVEEQMDGISDRMEIRLDGLPLDHRAEPAWVHAFAAERMHDSTQLRVHGGSQKRNSHRFDLAAMAKLPVTLAGSGQAPIVFVPPGRNGIGGSSAPE